MKPNFSDDSGVAFGFVMVSLFFAAAAAMWLVFGVQINFMLVDFLNPRIITGETSVQTRNTVSTLITIFRYSPVAIFIIGFLWSIRRAVYIKEGGY